MGTAVIEPRARGQSQGPAAFTHCMDEAHAILRDAADGWAAGDPERPTTLETLIQVLQVFVRGQLLDFPVFAARPRKR